MQRLAANFQAVPGHASAVHAPRPGVGAPFEPQPAADGRHPFALDAHRQPSKNSGRLSTRSDYGLVQPAYPDAELGEGSSTWPRLPFYDRPHNNLSEQDGPTSPRLTGAFAPQTDEVRHLAREQQWLRAQTLPEVADAELPPVLVRSKQLEPGAYNPFLDAPPPQLANGGGLRPVGATWPARPATAESVSLAELGPLSFLRDVAPPLDSAAGGPADAAPSWPPSGPTSWPTTSSVTWSTDWPTPWPTIRPAMQATDLNCALLPDQQLDPRRPPERQALTSHLTLRNFTGEALPAAQLAHRFPRLQSLVVLSCPALRSLADVAEFMPQLRTLMLANCPQLTTVGHRQQAYLPGAELAPPRLRIASVALCPRFVATHAALLQA